MSDEPVRPRRQPSDRAGDPSSGPWHHKTTIIAALSLAAILLHLLLRFGFHAAPGTARIPLLAALGFGLPLLWDLFRKLLRREFGSDLLGGISIVTSVLLGEYLAGAIIVLMLSGGEALESYALAQRLFGAGRARQADALHRAPEARGRHGRRGAGGDRGG